MINLLSRREKNELLPRSMCLVLLSQQELREFHQSDLLDIVFPSRYATHCAREYPLDHKRHYRCKRIR